MAEPTDDELVKIMKRMVKDVDLETTGVKKFTKLISKELGGINLSHRKAFIKTTLAEIINEMDGEEEEEEEEEAVEESEEESEEEEQPKKKRRKTNSGGGGGGLAAEKEISPELAAFLGKGPRMARTAIVKSLWEYIREHNLQDPSDKRQIILDEDMKAVFGTDRFSMFQMSKYVGAHIHPFKPVDLTTNSTPKKKKKSPKEKKPRKAGTQAPYQLSPELARVTGKQILPRPQVTKALWQYIRANDLQNKDDKREILCDANLKAVMGGKDKVTMFSMNKYITPHLIEKLDKSYYVHEDE